MFFQYFLFETLELEHMQALIATICPIIFSESVIKKGVKLNELYPTPPYRFAPNGQDYPSPNTLFAFRTHKEADIPYQKGVAPLNYPVSVLFEARGINRKPPMLSVYQTYEALTQAAMETLKNADKEGFNQLAPRGPFSNMEGGARVGYRAQSGAGDDGVLLLSLCHIFLPK